MSKPQSIWRGRALRAIAAVVVVLGLGALVIWGFIEGRSEAALEAERERPVKAPLRVSTANGTPVVTLDADTQQRSGIETMPLAPAPYREQVRAYGVVLDLARLTDLSNSYANAKAQLAIAQAKVAASQAAFQRAQVLHKDGQNFSTAQFEAAEATFQSDSASVRAAQVQTDNAAASAYQAWGPILGQSLVDGTTLAKDLVQHKKVLIQVTLPLGISLQQAPQTASIKTTTGQQVSIDFVSPATRTDPKIQGVSFFYTADAGSGALPGMNVIALLPAGQATPGVSVPGSAVVWLQGRAWVYLQTAANSFTRHEIATTQPQPNGGYVAPVRATTPQAESVAPAPEADGAAQGFPTDQPLVVKGAQMLLSQEFSAQIQVGTD